MSTAQRAQHYQGLLEQAHAEYTAASSATGTPDLTRLNALAAELAEYYAEQWGRDRDTPGTPRPGACPTSLYCEDCVFELLGDMADLIDASGAQRSW
ncbi:hypothetical protein GCM10027289_21660 [Tsukamurella serpentis]